MKYYEKVTKELEKEDEKNEAILNASTEKR